MFLTYLASPYSHDSLEVMEARYLKTAEVCASFAGQGVIVYSPICHWHPIAKRFDLPRDHAFWWDHNKRILNGCDVFTILKLEGWKESNGISQEQEHVDAIGKPTVHVDFSDCFKHGYYPYVLQSILGHES